jgi:peroxiredoxin
MPAVTLRTADGEHFDLNNGVSQQPSVLVFYRGGW